MELEYNRLRKIKEITHSEANQVIQENKPLGRFYFVEHCTDERLFIGIDNVNGEAWVEQFINLDACLHWLNDDFEMSELTD